MAIPPETYIVEIRPSAYTSPISLEIVVTANLDPTSLALELGVGCRQRGYYGPVKDYRKK